MRVLFFGMSGQFSYLPLVALLDAGIDVVGIVVPAGRHEGPLVRVPPPGARSPLPILNPFFQPTILHLAWERDLPAFEVGQLDTPHARATLAALQPDAICVACYPRRFPASLLSHPRLGCLNVHPSLLPSYRGPEPLFHAFRNGEPSTGVTVHLMDQRLDTGPILLQEAIDLPDGIDGDDVERRCARLGGRLLVDALAGLSARMLDPRPQPAAGTRAPFPSAGDWVIGTDWPARRAFNFMRGTAAWGEPYQIVIGDEQLKLSSAISYRADASLDAVYTRDGDEVNIQLAPGVLRAGLIGLESDTDS